MFEQRRAPRRPFSRSRSRKRPQRCNRKMFPIDWRRLRGEWATKIADGIRLNANKRSWHGWRSDHQRDIQWPRTSKIYISSTIWFVDLATGPIIEVIVSFNPTEFHHFVSIFKPPNWKFKERRLRPCQTQGEVKKLFEKCETIHTI